MCLISFRMDTDSRATTLLTEAAASPSGSDAKCLQSEESHPQLPINTNEKQHFLRVIYIPSTM